MLEAVRLQPFVLRASAYKSLEIAAGMQALPAPVRRGQKRHCYLVPERRAQPVIVIVLRMSADLFAEVAAIFVELPIRKRLVAAYELPRDAAPGPSFAAAVLHRGHLHVVPVGPEGAQDSTVMSHVAIPVGGALPDAHRGKMRRLQRGHVPLVDGVIRNAVEAHLAVRPRLHAGPLDAVVEVLRLARSEVIDEAGRTAGAARIDAHADVAVGHPFFRIDDLPALISVGRSVRNVRMLRHHALPRARVAFLKCQTLRVRAVTQDDGIASRVGRAEYIRAQRQPVIHRNRGIPFDAHAVAELARGRPHASSYGHNRGAVAIHRFYRAPI